MVIHCQRFSYVSIDAAPSPSRCKKHEREVFRGRLNKDRRAVLSGKCLTAKSAGGKFASRPLVRLIEFNKRERLIARFTVIPNRIGRRKATRVSAMVVFGSRRKRHEAL
jgi:hypothetical protein